MSTEHEPRTRLPAWDSESLRSPHDRRDKADRVRAMFDAIAPTYEQVNRLATFGRDALWRRRAVLAAAVRYTDVVLDVACGTGDMLREFARGAPPPARLIGVDFAPQMLARGDYTGLSTPVELIEADARDMPLPDESVDVISCAFGARNFDNLQATLREMRRVARPGARIVILEFATPPGRILRWLHRLYCNTVLPLLGRLIAHDQVGAYRYLPRSVQTFESQDSMVRRLRDAGFSDVTTRSMNFGGVVLYRGKRPIVEARRRR
jgi:demethylmenaquinone methyltransferase / 2-methoxy-6-polyprenyl-1,4-benzoquinol methylase